MIYYPVIGFKFLVEELYMRYSIYTYMRFFFSENTFLVNNNTQVFYAIHNILPDGSLFKYIF